MQVNKQDHNEDDHTEKNIRGPPGRWVLGKTKGDKDIEEAINKVSNDAAQDPVPSI